MGSGKTTIGRKLAKYINYSFIDLDAYIENKFHITISQIFKEKGNLGFRKIEQQCLKEVSEFENTIISTGGGTPCYFNNINIINETGISVYLKLSPDNLFLRLNKSKYNRPLITDKTDEELIDFINSELNKREKFYNQAKIIADNKNWTINDYIEALKK